MNRKLLIILFLNIYSLTFCQTNKLSSESVAIKSAFENLLQYPDSIELQKNYIKLFPDNAESFMRIFYSDNDGELTSKSSKYIYKLGKLSNNYPDLVGSKLVGICVGLKEYGDYSISFIQCNTIYFAKTNYESFIKIIRKLNKEDLSILVSFLADVENHESYGEYKSLMQKLSSNNETELYKLFSNAKTKRMNRNDH